MTPSERERRIEAATDALCAREALPDRLVNRIHAKVALDAADEAVPMVVNVAEPGCAYVVTPEMKRLADDHAALEQRAERAEAAARDFAAALREIRKRLEEDGCGAPDPSAEWYRADFVLHVHPSFSGEEGTEG